jgi:hypothetical protein
MSKHLDWDKARKLKADLRDPRNVARLDLAADNFLDHRTLNAKPKPSPKKSRAKSH